MFSKRPKGTGIFFQRTYVPGKVKIEQKIEDGDSVTIKVGSESILVKKLELIGDSNNRRIYYFKN